MSGGALTLDQSTVAANAAYDNYDGGGIAILDTTADPPLTIHNSIVADNITLGSNPDILHDPHGILDVDHSLIGDTSGLNLSQLLAIASGRENLTNVDPLLGPLAFHGGTHGDSQFAHRQPGD